MAKAKNPLKISIIHIYFLFFLCCSFAHAVTIDIYHTNDVHGRATDTKYTIGYAKIATIVDAQRAEGKHVLLLDAGDATQGLLFANLSKGRSIITIMNLMKYDAMVIGNHEFDFGQSNLKEIMRLAKFPVLSDNIRNTKSGKLFAKPSIVKNIGGVRIGIIGTTTPETPIVTHPDNVKGLTFDSPSQSVAKSIQALKGQVDAIIVLGHIGIGETQTYQTEMLAHDVQGIDLIIDGHSHTTLEHGRKIGNTLVVQTGAYSATIGHITMDFDDSTKQIVRMEAKLIHKNETNTIAPNKEIEAFITTEQKKIDAVESKAIGETKKDWIMSGNRTEESTMGALVAESMKTYAKTDGAITNSGGTRASIEAGKVTMGDVIAVLPFGNTIEVIQVTGKELKEILSFGLDGSGAFPQVAGMHVTYDSTAPKRKKLITLSINGKPCKDDATYTLAINSFLYAGGDGYTMLSKYNSIYSSTDTTDQVLAKLFENGTVDSLPITGKLTDISKK